MRILMLTNIYRPLVGGITRSIDSFADHLRERGHEVRIVAPAAEGAEEDPNVVHIPALSRVYKGKYSLPLLVPGAVHEVFREFRPDIVHSHHPFLLGVSGHRGAAVWNVPLVYTHHTRYDVYLQTLAHLPETVRNVVVGLSTGYCDLCNAVIAPGTAIANMLRERGTDVPIVVLPTGVDVARFATGDGPGFRERHRIPAEAFVVGHLGRLSPEKNLEFLAAGVARFLSRVESARCVIVGEGESSKAIVRTMEAAEVGDRLHLVGALEGRDVVDAYHAFDVFAFTSQSETQGMVVTEAMAAGVPVVAVDAPGVEDVVVDEANGRLLPDEDEDAFAEALDWVRTRDDAQRRTLRGQLRRTVEQLSIDACTDRLIALYEKVVVDYAACHAGENEEGLLAATRRFLDYEWRAWTGLLDTLNETLLGPSE